MLEYTENKIKILIVEDNEAIIESFTYLLEKEGFIVQVASTKKQAIAYIKNNQFNIFLLDVQLSDGTGFELCRYIKDLYNKPIIFVSAMTDEANVVYGLDMGADDYITKPFRNSELVSRIRSVLRRYTLNNSFTHVINYKNIKVDVDRARVYNNQEEIFLTNLEYRILLMFLNNANKVITRDELLEKVWDIDGNYVNDNSLSVYIKRLRHKIANTRHAERQIIQTVRGIGYILS
ncbi:MAG: response regulator transcription factor [Clostridia bacterium]|nr:response regulator transcription factor [Clostridia bacterium]